MVLWGHPDITFGLSSGDPAIEERAGEMFSAWAVPERSPDFCWEVREEAGGFRIVPPNNFEPLSPEGVLACEVYKDLDTALLNVEFQAVSVLSGRRESPLQVHGALLYKHGCGLALVGPKESGKSTLSTYLWTRGWQLLADDGFNFESETLVRPVPRRVRLRPTSHDLMPASFAGELPNHTHYQHRRDGTLLFQPALAEKVVNLRTLILLSADEGELVPIDSAQCTLDIIIHTNSYWIHGINGSLAIFSALLAKLNCYRLGRAPLATQYERLMNL